MTWGNVEARGDVSLKGAYGLLGFYEHQFNISEVVTARIATQEDQKSCGPIVREQQVSDERTL